MKNEKAEYTGKKANNFQRIRELPANKQSILSLVLLERMRPNYDLFVELTEFPQPFVMDNFVNRLWEHALVRGTKINFTTLEDKIEQMTPDESDYDMYGVFPAIYYCTGLLTYINGYTNLEDYDPVAIAKISQGSIVHLIEYQHADEDIENSFIREHELMLAEMDMLTELLNELEIYSLKSKKPQEIKQFFLDIAFADGTSNIGIELG